jgi:hypothetical protein
VSEFSSSRGGIAHLAHLGGFISAYFYIKSVYGDRVWDIFGSFRSLWHKKKKTPSSSSKLPKGWKVYSNPSSQPSVSQEEINRILDKISAHGMNSLTKEEMATLKKASGEMRH